MSDASGTWKVDSVLLSDTWVLKVCHVKPRMNVSWSDGQDLMYAKDYEMDFCWPKLHSTDYAHAGTPFLETEIGGKEGRKCVEDTNTCDWSFSE